MTQGKYERTLKTREKLRLNSLGKHPSEETRRKIGLAHLGEHFSEEHKRKIGIALKGRVYSDETIQKMKVAHKGTIISEETKRKLSLALKGRPKSEATKIKMRLSKKPWHFTEEQKEKLRKPKTEEHKQKLRLAHLGKRPSAETLLKISKALTGKPRLDLIGKHPSLETRIKMGNVHRGIKHTEEAKKRMSRALMGNKSRTGQHLSPEEIKNLHLALLKRKPYSHQHVSKPQKELYLLLKQIFHDAKLEYPIKTSETYRFADIGVPSLKIAFEYDSVYWHMNRKKEDEQRDKELAEVGWATFRITKETLRILSQQPRFVLLENEPK